MEDTITNIITFDNELQKKLAKLSGHQLFYIMLILMGWTITDIATHREVSYKTVWFSVRTAIKKMRDVK